jgi:tRNA A-37 threonylcarbamoyl transferase component Bud32
MTAGDQAVRWHLSPKLARSLLNSDGALRLEEWLANGSATIFKDAAHRTIYRVQANDLDFYLKQYRAVGPRNRLREVLRSTKAKAEFDKAAALTQRGILVPHPLGWGVLGNNFAPRASFLLSATVVDARHLTEVLTDLTPGRRQQLSTTLGEYVAQLHAAGVTHRDFHPGNLLVRWPANAAPQFVLIDLHEVHLGRPLSWRRRSDNLGVFNRYFILRASRTDRLRFWQAYAKAAGNGIPDHPDATPSVLEAATALSNYYFWTAREKKYVGNSRLVHCVASNSAAGFAARSLAPGTVPQLATDLDRWFDAANSRQLKIGGASTVAVTPFGVLKRFNVRSQLAMWKNRLRRSPALRSWVYGHALLDAGLPTPTPRALLRRRTGEEYLLTEELSNVADLRAFADNWAAIPIHQWRERLCVIARTLRQLHDRHFGHRDLKAGNLLTPADLADHRVWFIDLVGVSRRRRVSRKARVRDLARLLASFLNRPGLTHGDRLRFLFAYFGAANHSKAGWQRWWRELAEAAQAKTNRTRSRGRPLG